MVFVLTGQIEIYACLMFFALIHELGHMLVGIFIGLKPKTLQIMPFGLSVIFESYENRKIINIKKAIIAISGPLVNIAIAIITWIVNRNLLIIIYSNIMIALFNLLPIYPLDGGRILKALLKNKYNYCKMQNISNLISNITLIIITAFSSIIILVWQNIGLVFVIAYLWILVLGENKKYQLYKKIYNIIEKEEKKLYTSRN